MKRNEAADALKGANQDLRRLANDLKASRQSATKNRKLMLDILSCFDLADHTYRPSISFSAYGGRVSSTIEKLDGFKDPKLVRLLSALIEMGTSEEKTNDSPEYLNRDYRLKIPAPMGEIEVCIYAYAKEDNPTCRKILKSVSHRVVEDKTYDMVCD